MFAAMKVLLKAGIAASQWATPEAGRKLFLIARK